MAKLSTVSKKGQTTIPQEVRRSLDLHEGDHIIFEVADDGSAILRKVLVQDEKRDWMKSVEMTLAPEWSRDDDDDL
jgi:AbrB family looped-hinge helix DNA binding protein